MTKEGKSVSKKLAILLLLRPPILLLLVPLCLLLLHGNSVEDTTVDQRFKLSTSIEPPYTDTLRNAYEYSFAFCADPHLTAESEGCFADLNREIRGKRISFVVFGGDLTYMGAEGEYRNFVNRINALTVPVYPAVGNHDIYGSGWSYYWRYLGPSVYCFCGGNAKFVVIDSASDKIGQEQMEWIARELRNNKQPLLFVISHVPIYGVSHSGYNFPKGEERSALIELFEKYEVDCVLQGHYHSYEDITVNGVRYITSGSFSDGLLNAGDRHFLLLNVYGPEVTVEKIPVGADIPVQYLDGEI